jgi:hypothetical protein
MSKEVQQAISDMGTNPFIVGPIVPPERFYGRTAQREDIRNRIGCSTAQCVSIIGMRRSGKSSLLRYIRERIHEFCPSEHLVIVPLNLQDRRFHTPEGISEGLRRGIEKTTGNTPWHRSDNNNEWAITDGLEKLRDDGQRLLVLIDEFEQIGRRLELFQDWGDDLRAKASAGLLALVIATLRPIDEIYEYTGLTSPFGNIFTSTILGSLESDEWQRLVYNGFIESNIDIDDSEIELIDQVAGGLPFYTQLAATLIWRHKDPLKIREEFRIQVEPHFRVLWIELTETERQVLLQAANLESSTNPLTIVKERMQLYGLLRSNGKPFSSVFVEFMQSHR